MYTILRRLLIMGVSFWPGGVACKSAAKNRAMVISNTAVLPAPVGALITTLSSLYASILAISDWT